MRAPSYSHTVGFDDAPFSRDHRGDVPIVGAVFAGLRLEGVLCGKVRRDGANATRELIRLIGSSRYRRQLQLILLQGISLAGFNVVDIGALHQSLGIPVIAVVRRQPRMARVRTALLSRVPGGAQKWRLVERLGPAEPLAGLYVQRAAIDAETAERVLSRLAVAGTIPEPLRTAHLIAGAIATGQSRGRT